MHVSGVKSLKRTPNQLLLLVEAVGQLASANLLLTCLSTTFEYWLISYMYVLQIYRKDQAPISAAQVLPVLRYRIALPPLHPSELMHTYCQSVHPGKKTKEEVQLSFCYG
jgi:hypothetical protein